MLWLKRYWPLILGLLYLLSPIDLLPDTLPGLGWIDDILLGIAAYWLFRHWGSWRHGPAEHSGSNGKAKQERPVGSDPYRNPYEILGIAPGATAEDIRSAYRKQAQRYHPDRVSHLGEEFQQMAKQKFQEIQRAYETLSHRTG